MVVVLDGYGGMYHTGESFYVLAPVRLWAMVDAYFARCQACRVCRDP